MSENKDFELFGGGPAPSEGGEQNDEQFREEMRQTQAAMAQLKKEEGKARTNDDKLAKIIVQFLSQPGNTDLFLLISRCVAQNIPSEVLIAILSLVDRTAFMEVGNILKEIDAAHALTTQEHSSIHSLTEGQMASIHEWVGNIGLAASTKPHRVLESFLIKKTNEEEEIITEICLPLVQLSAFIVRNFLAMQSTEVEYATLHEFMETVYVKLVHNLQELVEHQKKLN